MKEGFNHIRDLTWEEVFEFWRQNEGDDSKWGHHAKERGFESWEAWRQTYGSTIEVERSHMDPV